MPPGNQISMSSPNFTDPTMVPNSGLIKGKPNEE
jgi:hypothetical protein